MKIKLLALVLSLSACFSTAPFAQQKYFEYHLVNETRGYSAVPLLLTLEICLADPSPVCRTERKSVQMGDTLTERIAVPDNYPYAKVSVRKAELIEYNRVSSWVGETCSIRYSDDRPQEALNFKNLGENKIACYKSSK